ncbi:MULTISPECIES: FHA domain-containing protein [Acinetobacter]|uniref:FHA domain-containing protein n=1 Tax=Acinetobacter TaxID=469 RepID=UPI000537D8F2|nr:FHA domain-containing protein [Acinetobacter sp. HR7]KGT48047.1 signal peptide protein [Acinetobacter sp. HR7]
MTWKIQAISGDLTGQEISIDHDMLVGRHQAADIVLQAAEISRKHAAFLVKEDALWVQDLGSSNGTFVNDQRIDAEALLKEGDIVQFASLKFSVLAPAQEVVVEPELEQTAERVIEEAEEKNAAHQMNEQGMPELKERDASVQLTRDGMPTNVGIPKPAPIPEGVDLSKATPEPKSIPVEEPVSRVEQAKEEQKNASVGLISLIVLIILAIVAWLFFK